ncbi:MAG: cytochrome c3 family protein [Anaerolineae bacterium]
MRRPIFWIWVLFGLCCIGLGVWVGSIRPVDAQGIPEQLQDAEYVGMDECSNCHRGLVRVQQDSPHGLALQEVSRSQEEILADFTQGEDLRMVQFPGESQPRPFTADDIEYVVGAGRYVQRYLYEVDRREYAVFPAEWDVQAGEWRPYRLAENWPDPAYDWNQNCAGCHTTGLEPDRGRWQDDGVQCEMCHGPGSLHIEAARDAGRNPTDEEAVAVHAAIVLTPDAQVCAQCHSAGSEPTTNHPYPVDYHPGGVLVHENVFTLVSEDDPNAWYGGGYAHQSNMQYNEWVNSGHATSLETMRGSESAQDGCLTCHSGDYAFTQRILQSYEDGDLSGPLPEAVTLQNATNSITCTVCHSPHAAADTEFNLTSDPYTLCTTCHQNTDLMSPVHHPVREMFEGQAIVEGVDGVPSAHFSAEDGPRCVDCHMTDVQAGSFTLANHTFRPIVPGEADTPPDSCSRCHNDLTTGDLQSLVDDTQADVRGRLSIAWARIGSVPTPEAGSDAEALYQRTVAVLTFVQNDGSLGVHNYAYVDALLNQAGVMLTELSVPGSNLQPTEAPAPTATPQPGHTAPVAIERNVTTGFTPMTFIILGTVALILVIGSAVYVRQARRQSKETTS